MGALITGLPPHVMFHGIPLTDETSRVTRDKSSSATDHTLAHKLWQLRSHPTPRPDGGQKPGDRGRDVRLWMNGHQTGPSADIHLNPAAGFEELMELSKDSYQPAWEAGFLSFFPLCPTARVLPTP